MYWLRVVVVAYLVIGAGICVKVHRDFKKSGLGWSAFDNFVTVVVTLFWPLALAVAVLVTKRKDMEG